MNLSNYTIKAQQTIAAAQQHAFNNNNPSIETEHLLQVLLEDKDSTVSFLLKKNNVNAAFVAAKVTEAMAKLPKVQGAEPAAQIGRDLNTALLKANSMLATFEDEFISPEHLLLGLLHVNDSTAKTLKDAGLTEKGLVAAIKELRKGEKIS